jgi:phosphatidylglycerol:prolipoprotein diacylglycerol transferase
MTIFSVNILWITISPSYYWLMYAIWFLAGYYIIKRRVKNSPSLTGIPLDKGESLEDLFLYIFLWVILWWRLGYVLFYNFSSYISEPLSILKIWEWWMSFHGWVIWVILAMILFSKKYNFNFLKLADQVTLVLPIWLWLGRIWNYLNGELLWYSWYTWFLAVYKNWVWYFPSPLLEALLEWLILFIILNTVYYINTKVRCVTTNKPIKYGFDWQIASLFLIFYSIFRILVEIFFRSPDSHIWYIFWYFTIWELLTIPMLILGIYCYYKLSLTND